MSAPTYYHDTFPPATKLQHLTLDWAGQSVVDLGCNTGALGPYVLERGAASYVGYEANADWAAEGRRRYPHLTIHTNDVRDADLRCDILCALGLFHHLPDRVVGQIIRGTVAHTIVIEQPMGDAPFQRYQMRTEQWYRDLLTNAGYTTITRVPYGFSYPVDRAILVGTRRWQS
jgi:SAM-dependent methyltransferase